MILQDYKVPMSDMIKCSRLVYDTIGIQTKPRYFAPAKQYFRAEGSRAPCPASPHALGSDVTPPCQRASTF